MRQITNYINEALIKKDTKIKSSVLTVNNLNIKFTFYLDCDPSIASEEEIKKYLIDNWNHNILNSINTIDIFIRDDSGFRRFDGSLIFRITIDNKEHYLRFVWDSDENSFIYLQTNFKGSLGKFEKCSYDKVDCYSVLDEIYKEFYK